MLKRTELVQILIFSDNTELRIPIDTLLDKLSADTWSDIHRYKDSYPCEFAIGKISDKYDGWVQMPLDNNMLDRFIEHYFIDSKIKLLCNINANINDILYVTDSSCIWYDNWPIRIKSDENRKSALLHTDTFNIVNGKKIYYKHSTLSKFRRLYCVYISLLAYNEYVSNSVCPNSAH